jgi:NAD(P) transhydrogenase subunit alpha
MAEHSEATAGLLIGVPRERATGERRVAASPDSVKRLITKLGFRVQIEAGAGVEAGFTDAAYAVVGAQIVDLEAIWGQSDLVLKVNPPLLDPAAGVDELAGARRGLTLVCPVQPAQNKALVERMAALGLTVLALDAVPRITRAQTMDIRSSMANLAGYRAVIEAASRFGARSARRSRRRATPPAKVLVIGAGVAGLAAIAAARGLGAVVRAFDTRAAAREQVQSLGAEFLTVELKSSRARALAATPRRCRRRSSPPRWRCSGPRPKRSTSSSPPPSSPTGPRPKLWMADDMVESMKPGSMVVDLAAPAAATASSPCRAIR